jgi:hyperosmotically inducible periplasmic protein
LEQTHFADAKNPQLRNEIVKHYSMLFLAAAVVCGCDYAPRTRSDVGSAAPSTIPGRETSAVDQSNRSGLGTQTRTDQARTDGGAEISTSRNAPDRDNTAVNQRDRSDNAVTPLDQHQNQEDIDITADIRRQVVDSEMSVNAQNVKIVTQDGNVTLRGPVETDDERRKIETIAREVAGDTKVDNQLEVAKSN